MNIFLNYKHLKKLKLYTQLLKIALKITEHEFH
jgi:hypothetical protein